VSEHDVDDDQLVELGFYGLAGHTNSPADLLHECATADDLGLGSVFISERFNLKEAGVLCGAAAASSSRLGIATAATNHNTRHPLVTATLATTMHRMSGGRFALGLGRGFDVLFNLMGLAPITSAQMTDAIDVLRRLWRGQAVVGHDGPSGSWPYLSQDPSFDEDIPIMLCALGPKTLEVAGAIADAVVLHTFFTDQTLANSVAAVRAGAERAGRDPDSVRVWSVLATVGDHLEHDLVLRKLTGRLATYLQAYGDLLVRVNGWDPAALSAFRDDEVVGSVSGAIDAVASTEQLEHITTLLPAEWLAAAATGSASACAERIVEQFDAGADGVICHGVTPAELAPVVQAYRGIRPAGRFETWVANPGCAAVRAQHTVAGVRRSGPAAIR
jgi:5,10-methylenetetrahydromethanopterin reductase